MTTDDKRVCFDFDVEFSNGGGIQGQDFRLDITGEEIDDDELAAAIIGDRRLLMVSRVRILNKRIITEPHKRTAPEPTDAATTPPRGVIDLSHPITDGMTTYPGLPAPAIGDHLSHAASRASYAEGTVPAVNGRFHRCTAKGRWDGHLPRLRTRDAVAKRNRSSRRRLRSTSRQRLHPGPGRA